MATRSERRRSTSQPIATTAPTCCGASSDRDTFARVSVFVILVRSPIQTITPVSPVPSRDVQAPVVAVVSAIVNVAQSRTHPTNRYHCVAVVVPLRQYQIDVAREWSGNGEVRHMASQPVTCCHLHFLTMFPFDFGSNRLLCCAHN